jgi:hypothetical protein
MTQTGTWELQIWDLGFSADQLIKPEALACMDLRRDVHFHRLLVMVKVC